MPHQFETKKFLDQVDSCWELKEQIINLEDFVVKEVYENLDRFEVEQLSYVLATCLQHPSMASAGRFLFNKSREEKVKVNDSSRLQKYLARYNLKWQDISNYKTP